MRKFALSIKLSFGFSRHPRFACDYLCSMFDLGCSYVDCFMCSKHIYNSSTSFSSLKIAGSTVRNLRDRNTDLQTIPEFCEMFKDILVLDVRELKYSFDFSWNSRFVCGHLSSISGLGLAYERKLMENKQ